MNLKISKKGPLLFLYVGGALLLLVAAWFWCFKVSADPERVFWATVERGLATHGVTIEAEQSTGGTNVKQIIRYSLGADNRSHSLTTLNQAGTTIVNEMLGTPTADYTRYVSIKTDQKRADGSDMDFSKLVGVWAKSQAGSSQFFTQALFGSSLPIGGMGVLIGNLAPEARDKLIKQIRDDVVYQTDFTKTKKERVDGRLLYTYEATIQPVAYVAMVKQFAISSGQHGLDDLDPGTYRGQKPFKLMITIDARARQVVKIESPDSGGSQAYSGYDIPVQLELPKNTITGTELQQRLSEAQ